MRRILVENAPAQQRLKRGGGLARREFDPDGLAAPERPEALLALDIAKATAQRLTEKTMCTQFGLIVGTLDYLSPEPAELSAPGVDTRSDISSLGVLLYELLTGTTPLDRTLLREAAYIEIPRRIKKEEPPRPSTRLSTSTDTLPSISAQRRTDPAWLAKVVRGGLDWIVMKSLEKDRAPLPVGQRVRPGRAARPSTPPSRRAPRPSRTSRTRKAKLGPDHPDVATGLANLGSGLLEQGKWGEAEAVLRECLPIREAKLPDD